MVIYKITLGFEFGGQKNHPEYKVWKGMNQRCFGKTGKLYPQYGGRGIRVCFRWLNSFKNFIEDMGPRPEGMILGRKDLNAWYTPENCIWTTRSHQSAKKRQAKNIDHLPGVFKRGNVWRAAIGINYKKVGLGNFATQELAYAAYANKFKEVHGLMPDVRS